VALGWEEGYRSLSLGGGASGLAGSIDQQKVYSKKGISTVPRKWAIKKEVRTRPKGKMWDTPGKEVDIHPEGGT